MANKSLQLWAAVLLLIGGLVHLVPQLYTGLVALTGGTPWIQIIIGILSVIVALVLFAGEKQGVDSSSTVSR
jgi:membrane-bound ClpP family serine protease